MRGVAAARRARLFDHVEKPEVLAKYAHLLTRVSMGKPRAPGAYQLMCQVSSTHSPDVHSLEPNTHTLRDKFEFALLASACSSGLIEED